MKRRPKALFISHGGGPLSLLGDAGHREMVACLENIAATMPRPDAVVVVSAHWEASVPTITATRMPSLIYDYYGFPAESYEIEYPCPGEPSLAKQIQDMLGTREIKAELDADRGIDHGVFVPLKIMYPEADIPCVQLSLVRTLEPAQHIAIGQALQGLAEQNVLVIGSGFSFHNLKAFFAPQTAQSREANQSFEGWLTDICVNTDYPDEQRRSMLEGWSRAPGARFCHPREEHLLPLHVCYGVAQSPCVEHYELTILNKKCSMYRW